MGAGLYELREGRTPRPHRTHAPTSEALTHLCGSIARRVCRHLAKRGYLESQVLAAMGEAAYALSGSASLA